MEKTYLLKPPCEVSSDEYAQFIEEYHVHDQILVPITLAKDSSNFPEFVRCLQEESAGINLPQGYVPASTYFMTDETGRIYGCVMHKDPCDRFIIATAS